MNKGFTIVELISVISLLGLLLIIVTPSYGNVSDNIRKKNYESRKSEIKTQVLSFVEKYAKDKVYEGNKDTNYICFTPKFLIQNGIITSDDNKDEYIKNDYTGQKYINDVYLQILYDIDKKKLYSLTVDDSDFDKDKCNKTDNEIFK